MKTKVFGSYTYFVSKYYRNEDGNLSVEITKWLKKERAFEDAKRHEDRYGENMAFVHKAKQCIEIE